MPDVAGELWRAVLDGEWIILESFEHRGRRFVVFRRKPRGAVPVPLLTRREENVLALRANAHGIKQIAFGLGLSEATVSRTLARGMRKLGLTCASELMRFGS